MLWKSANINLELQQKQSRTAAGKRHSIVAWRAELQQSDEDHFRAFNMTTPTTSSVPFAIPGTSVVARVVRSSGTAVTAVSVPTIPVTTVRTAVPPAASTPSSTVPATPSSAAVVPTPGAVVGGTTPLGKHFIITVRGSLLSLW